MLQFNPKPVEKETDGGVAGGKIINRKAATEVAA